MNNINILKWLILTLLISLISGSSSAIFLISLEWITNIRIAHFQLIYTLPIIGFIIALIYKKWGETISKGNNLVIEEIQSQNKIITWYMSPIILITTLLTHLSGGSAGREGTAIQMSSAVNDQLTNVFKLDDFNRKTLLLASVAAGFSSVFGTPLAGAVFALEFACIGSIQYLTIIPILLASFGADYITQKIWQVSHTQYLVYDIPSISLINLGYVILLGLIFGIVAMAYSIISKYLNSFLNEYLPNIIWKTVLGGCVLLLIFLVLHYVFKNDKYQGLGILTIIEAFSKPSSPYDFALKFLLTIFTLAVGFKGGEVTPLFFIGATLGSALSLIIPLPISLLAAIGFVSVFAGCARTPLACIVMGVELFGVATIPFIAISCLISFLTARKYGIYESQKTYNYLNKSSN